MNKRRKTIGVIGSGKVSHQDLSAPLGKWIAEHGFHLINGGGQGVMARTAQAFVEVKNRKGQAMGILPASAPCSTPAQRSAYGSPSGYPNAFVDLVIRTHLPQVGPKGKESASRNHILILSSDVVIALPGGAGTRSEIELAMEYGKPLIVVSPSGEWNEFASKTVVVTDLATAFDVLTGWIH